MTRHNTLSSLLASSGVLDENVAVAYIKAIAPELSLLTPHQGITPDEVTLDNDGNITVAPDITSREPSSPYLPEDCTEGELADVYSLAAILYRMVTGMAPTPYTARTEGKSLLSLPSSVSQGVARAIERGLKLNPNLRQPSPEAFVRQLEEAPAPERAAKPRTKVKATSSPTKSGGRPIPAPVHADAEPVDETSAESSSRFSRAITILVITGVIITLTAGGAWLYFHHSSATAAPVDGRTLTPDTIPAPDSVTPPDTTTIEMNDSATVVEMQIKNENGFSFTYTGPTVKGLPDGDGHGVYENGVYEGRYVAGVREGKGSFITNDGENHFEGTFKADFYDEGTMMFPDSTYYRGTFRDSELYNGNLYDSKGTPVAAVRAGVIRR